MNARSVNEKLHLLYNKFVNVCRLRSCTIGFLVQRMIRRLRLPIGPDVLTVGFARRFATYKRGLLLFGDRNLRKVSSFFGRLRHGWVL